MEFKGTPAAKEVLIGYLLKCVDLKLNFALFTYPEPLPSYPVSLNYVGRILFLLHGNVGIIGSDGKSISVRPMFPDSVLYTGEHCWAGLEYEGHTGTTVSLIIMPDYIRTIVVNFVDGEPLTRPYYHTANIPRDTIVNIIKAMNVMIYDSTGELEQKTCLLSKTVLLEVIGELRKDSPHPLGKAEQSYKLVRDYIDHNYQYPINRNDICLELNLNPCYVSRLFTKYHGDKINNYLEKCRMGKARKMLMNYHARVAQVAKQCGYSSEAYFIKVFKKAYGTTPGKFRNKNSTS